MASYPRAIRRCSYKGCNASQHTHSHLTFFQFPRDPERCKIWTQKSQCADTPALKFLCCKHFDASKYIAHNTRRKLLLSSAIPYDYVPPKAESFDEIIDEELEHEQEQEDAHEKEESSNDNVESTMNDFEEEEEYTMEQLCDEVDISAGNLIALPLSRANSETNQKDPEYESTEEQVIYCNIDDSELVTPSTRKRKAEPTVSPRNVKLVKATVESTTRNTKRQATPTKAVNNTSSSSSQEIDLQSLLPSGPDVSTFIFKGEEYVQMPKAAYIQDKLDLYRKVQMYKQIIETIKSNVDGVEL